MIHTFVSAIQLGLFLQLEQHADWSPRVQPSNVHCLRPHSSLGGGVWGGSLGVKITCVLISRVRSQWSAGEGHCVCGSVCVDDVCVRMESPYCIVMWMSRISGMEWWNKIVEWNTGMTFVPTTGLKIHWNDEATVGFWPPSQTWHANPLCKVSPATWQMLCVTSMSKAAQPPS